MRAVRVDDFAQWREAARALLAAGIPLARLRIRPRTLEDLFLELTGRGLRE